jgi:hypothetical protein
MADPDFPMGRGDAFLLTDVLEDDDGNHVPTGPGATVVLRYRIDDHTQDQVDAPATITSAVGDVERHFAPADTITGSAGPYPTRDYLLLANWIVTYPNGDQVTVPSNRKLVIFVQGLP